MHEDAAGAAMHDDKWEGAAEAVAAAAAGSLSGTQPVEVAVEEAMQEAVEEECCGSDSVIPDR
jgi:hypothetical protein